MSVQLIQAYFNEIAKIISAANRIADRCPALSWRLAHSRSGGLRTPFCGVSAARRGSWPYQRALLQFYKVFVNGRLQRWPDVIELQAGSQAGR